MLCLLFTYYIGIIVLVIYNIYALSRADFTKIIGLCENTNIVIYVMLYTILSFLLLFTRYDIYYDDFHLYRMLISAFILLFLRLALFTWGLYEISQMCSIHLNTNVIYIPAVLSISEGSLF